MGKVSSVVDTVLGEALAGDYADMVGIVSVIDNRSRATGVSYQDVVAAPGQFDAFGKSLPAGVGKYRDMATQAIADVKARGPVHAATFYATPAAAKGLPKGLALETKTRGHNYYSDPKGRAIATTQGYKSPDLSKISPASRAVAMTPEVGPVPTAKPDVGPTAVGFAPEAPTARSEDAFSSVMGAPSRGTGLADLSPSFSPGSKGTLSSFDTTGLAPSAVSMVGKMNDMGFGSLGVNSGYRSAAQNQRAGGASQSKHMSGLAIDVATRGLSDTAKSKALDAALSAGAKGIGLYSSGNMHFDTRGTPAFWGPMGYSNPGATYADKIANMPAWARDDLTALVDAGEFGYLSSGINNNVPTPTPAPRNDDGTPMAASFDQSAFNAMTPDIGMPSAPAGGFSQASFNAMTNDIGMPGAGAPSAPGFSQASFNEMTADIGMPGTGSKGFSQTAFNEMTDDIGMPTAGPSFGNVTSTTQAAKEDAILDGLEQAAKQQAAAAPTVAPVAAPNPVAPAAVATPAANVMAAPSGGARSAPTAPAPAATAADVWGGKAAAGRATNGNQVSRNPDGTISMTSSKYGYTDTYAPDGSFRGTTAPGLFGIDQAARSMFGGLGTGKGLAAPGFGKGFSAKGALSGAAKGMAFGVPGMAIGAVLGGFATPVAPTPAQAIRSYQQGYQGGLGFPTAPDGPSSQGGLTAYGEAASRGDFGGQAAHAADNPGTGLF
jgi:hypothetical protein